jgi:hypothetical protein
MPGIYRIVGSGEVPTHQLPVGAAGAVIHGGDEGELVCWHLAILKNDAFHVIRHPTEEADLRANGETFNGANEKGILFHIEPHLCCDCGKTVQVPELSYRLRGGCLGPLLIGLGVGARALAINWRAPIIAIASAFAGLMASGMAWEFCSKVVRRLKFGSLMEKMQVATCPACGCNRLAAVSKVRSKGLTLKNGSVVRVQSAGVS